MLIGGAGSPHHIRTPATADCEVLDVDAASPAWESAAPMHHRRVMPDAVLLPDGTVFVTSGSRAGFADNGADPVYHAEIYDPNADTWTELCPMTIPRLYHASAILLPDARVLVAGSDLEWNPPPFDIAQTEVEVFSPPYLFHGPRPAFVDSGLRPHLSATYGASLTVLVDGPEVVEAVLVRCGTATHSFNSDQRLVALEITSRAQLPRFADPVLDVADRLVGGVRDATRHLFPPSWQPTRRWPPRPLPLPPRWPGRRRPTWPPSERPLRRRNVQRLTLQLPPDRHIAPPGYYLVFVLSAQRVPSDGRLLRLG